MAGSKRGPRRVGWAEVLNDGEFRVVATRAARDWLNGFDGEDYKDAIMNIAPEIFERDGIVVICHDGPVCLYVVGRADQFTPGWHSAETE